MSVQLVTFVQDLSLLGKLHNSIYLYVVVEGVSSKTNLESFI